MQICTWNPRIGSFSFSAGFQKEKMQWILEKWVLQLWPALPIWPLKQRVVIRSCAEGIAEYLLKSFFP